MTSTLVTDKDVTSPLKMQISKDVDKNRNKKMNIELKTIQLRDIYRPQENNCRGEISITSASDLARDIEIRGLIHPVLVCMNTGRPDRLDVNVYWPPYKLLCGFKRCMAMDILKRDSIDATIRQDVLDDLDATLINVAENLQRESLDIVQEANVIQKLRGYGQTEQQVAQKLGMSRGWVQIRTMLLALPTDIIPLVRQGHISHPEIRMLYTINRENGAVASIDAAYRIKLIREERKKSKKVKASRNLPPPVDVSMMTDVSTTTNMPTTQNTSVNEPHVNIVQDEEKIKLDEIKKKLVVKKTRTKTEIFKMQEFIRESKGSGVETKLLAWAAGEIETPLMEKILNESWNR